MNSIQRISNHYSAITVIAAIVGTSGILIGMGIGKPLESDAVFFNAIAKNVVEHAEYANPRSPWPNAPALDRLPGWTFILSAGLFLFRSIPAPILVRLLAGGLNILGAWLLARLTFKLSGSQAASLLAGLAYALYLPALSVTQAAVSEPGFICVLLWAVSALLDRKFIFASFLLGLGCLFRGNMMLLVPLLALFIFGQINREAMGKRLATAAICCAVFLILPGAWIARNTLVGNCPLILSTTSGEVLRGSYNSVVLDGELWGYWVFPDEIPGEIRFQQLAKSMNQCELCKYYQAEAKSFAVEHLTEMPKLILGRLIRAYVPIPFKLTAAALAGYGNRALLYLAFLLTIPVWRKHLPNEYGWILLIFFAVSLFTTVAMVANSRHVLWLEVLLFPPAAVGVTRLLLKQEVSDK